MKKFLPFLSVFLLGVLVGFTILYGKMWLGQIESIPSRKAADFVNMCGGLNGEELSVENIAMLNGVCWVSGKIESCGGQLLSRLQDGRDPYFEVYHKKPDNTWVCSINQSEDGKMKTGTYYMYD